MNPRRVRSYLVRQGSFLAPYLGILLLAASVLTGVAADPLSTWKIRTNTSSIFRPFVTGEGIIVTGDDRGAIYTSLNGATWVRRDTGTNIIIRGLSYGDGRFVALFAIAGFSTSEDGVTWTKPVANFSRNFDIFDVEYGQGVHVAVGYEITPPYTAVILRSSDGVAWETQRIATNGIYRTIAYGNGRFVASGHAFGPGGLVSISPDGVEWGTQRFTNSYIYSLAAGNGRFVGLSTQGIVYSTNGTQWEVSSSLPITGLMDVSFAEGLFIVTGDLGRLATSTDGNVWTTRQTKVAEIALLSGAGGIGHRIVVGGRYLLQSGGLAGALPLITQPPASRVQQVGTTYANRVVVESEDPVTFQWLHDGIPVPGATNDFIQIPNATENVSGIYSAVVSSARGSSTSSAPALIAVPVGISVQPISQQIIQGGTATFSVVVTGTPPVAFRWRRAGVTTNFAVLDSHASFLTIPNVQTSATYSVVVSNIVRSPGELSEFVTLTVVPDSDRDGLPDAYETERGFNLNDPADGPLDTDGDGVSNAEEYLAGTDPRQAQSFLKVDRITAAAGARLEFTTAPGQTYTVLFSDDLNSGVWTRLADIPARTSSSNETIYDPFPSINRYYRLVTPRQP